MTDRRDGPTAVERVSIGPLDKAFAGHAITVAAGPADHGGVEVVRQVVADLAARGPTSRLGLKPTRLSRRWAYDPSRAPDNVFEAPAKDLRGMVEALPDWSAEGSSEKPFRCGLIGENLLIQVDHGLGDATLCIELIAAISQRSTANFPHAYGRNPLGTTMLRMPLTISPTAIKKPVWDGVPDPPMTSIPDDAYAGFEFARGAAGFPVALKRFRDEHYPGTATTVLLTSAISRAFNEVGIPTSGVIDVPVDLRRYLPKNRVTLGNLSTIVSVDVSPDATPAELTHALTFELRSLRNYLRMLAFSGKEMALNERLDKPQLQLPTRGGARLAVTDLSRHPAMRKMHIKGGDHNGWAAIMNYPGFVNGIGVTLITVGGQLCVSVSFLRSVYSPETVRKAVDLFAADPFQFLSR